MLQKYFNIFDINENVIMHSIQYIQKVLNVEFILFDFTSTLLIFISYVT